MRQTLTIALFAALVVSCSNKPKPLPDPVYDNYYTYLDEAVELKWAGVINYDKYWMESRGFGVFLSIEAPESDSLGSVGSLKELIYVNIMPEMLGKSINLSADETWEVGFRNDSLGVNYNYVKVSTADNNDPPKEDDGPLKASAADPPVRGTMTVDIKSGLLYVSMDLKFEDGKTFNAKYKGAATELLVSYFGGTMTGTDGVRREIDMTYFGFEEGGPNGGVYNITLDATQDAIVMHRLEFVIPAEFVNDTISLLSGNSPLDRPEWSFKYTDYTTHTIQMLYESTPKDQEKEGNYMLLVVDDQKQEYHIELLADPYDNPDGELATMSCKYTGSFGSENE